MQAGKTVPRSQPRVPMELGARALISGASPQVTALAAWGGFCKVGGRDFMAGPGGSGCEEKESLPPPLPVPFLAVTYPPHPHAPFLFPPGKGTVFLLWLLRRLCGQGQGPGLLS